MNTHQRKEKAVIESLRSKGIDDPYTERRRTLQYQWYLLVFASVMIIISLLIAMLSEDAKPLVMDELTSELPFLVIAACYAFRARQRMNALNDLERFESS